MTRGSYYQLSLVTFPGLGIALFAISWSALVATRSWSGPAARLLYATSLLGIGLGLALVLWVMKAALSGPTRGRARFGLAYNSALILFLCWLCEIWLPVSPESHEQWIAEQLVRRRHQENKATFRGAMLWPGKANEMGWLDRTHSLPGKSRRVVFIGDSMLEIRSRRRLALRVEDRFADDKVPLEVINLSMCGADPLDYRIWLNEFALDYHPSEVFVFMYGPNDFFLTGPYEPYRSPLLRVNSRSVQGAKEAGLAPEIVTSLRKLARKGNVYSNRQALLAAVGCPMSTQQGHLLYNLVMAYSDAIRRGFPSSTHYRLLNAGSALVDGSVRTLAAAGLKAARANPDWWQTGEFVSRYDAIFLTPREGRLQALAQLFAEFMQMSPEPVMQLLQAQRAEFIDYLTEQPDMTWYLAQPLNRLAGLAEADQRQAPDLAARIRFYQHLFGEMEATTRAHGCKLTIVFIPHPGLTDPEFIRFWGDHLTVSNSGSTGQALMDQLPESLNCIDLGRYNDRLRGKYWKLDAHWTDEGNDVVADILADYLKGGSRRMR